MKTLIFILGVLALISGLTGSGLLFYYGLPSRIESEAYSFLVAEQPPEEIEQIKIQNKKIRCRAQIGIILIGTCFIIQLAVLILEKVIIKKN